MDEWTKKYHKFKRVNEPLSQVEQLIKDAFEEQFAGTTVELIRIREPQYFDDPDFLDIACVFSSENGIETKKGIEFFGILEDKLSEINEERFPSISFIEYDDYMENTPKELLS